MPKKLSELYAPKPQGEKDFVAKHPVTKTTDKSPATKNDANFMAKYLRTYDRSPRHGYNPGEDEKANDGTTGVNDQKASPSNGSAVYPSGTFKEEEEIEETERLDELSPKTLKSYVKKAGGTGRQSGWAYAERGGKEEDKAMSTDGYKYPEKQARHQKIANQHYRKSNNRDKGVERAQTQLFSKDNRLPKKTASAAHMLKNISKHLKDEYELDLDKDQLIDFMLEIFEEHEEQLIEAQESGSKPEKEKPAYVSTKELMKSIARGHAMRRKGDGGHVPNFKEEK